MKKQNWILTLIIYGPLLIALILGATYTLKTSTPAGTDDPREADDRVRELKAAFVERLDVDHYFHQSATSTYDAADCGKHRYITFREPNSIVSVATDEGMLYIKDAAGKAELWWIDEDENDLQLTSVGTINITSSDLLGTLANNTYFSAVDNAGTGTVDLIKADANDISVLPNTAQLATSTAPTQTKQVACKKYVDDQVDTQNMTPAAYAGEESVTFSNGLILKQGYKAGILTQTVSFAEAFTTVSFGQITMLHNSEQDFTPSRIKTLTTSGMTVYNGNVGTGFYWQAWGY